MSIDERRAGPRLADQLCHALYAASGALTRAYRPLLEPLDLTYPQFVIMMALWEHDDVPSSTLARTVGLGKATVTPLLQRLEVKGLITRRSDPADERRRRVRLTKRGAKLAIAGEAAAERAFCATGLGKREAVELQRQCRRLTAHLEAALD